MRRIFSISAIIALLYSAAAPSLMAAQVAGNAPMACHRPALGTSQSFPQHHCHDMAGMAENDAMESDAAALEDLALMGAVPEKCPMECCTMVGTAQHAAVAAPLNLTFHVVIERSFLLSKVVFSRSGFSSHTDRGPPIA